MVWCLLVVPNYCMVDPLAKVNKTTEATPIPLYSNHNQTYRELCILAIWMSPWICPTYFGHSMKKLLTSTWFFFPTLLLYGELKRRLCFWVSSTPMFASGPSERAVGAMKYSSWNQNILCQNRASFVFWWLRLLLTLCTHSDVLCFYVHFLYLP